MAPPLKQPNAARRSREYLTPAEIDRLMAAARQLGRHGHRDATMILVAYRHGLRVSELVSLRREQVDLRQGLLHVRRRKNGLPSTHPLRGPELRALRKLLRERMLERLAISGIIVGAIILVFGPLFSRTFRKALRGLKPGQFLRGAQLGLKGCDLVLPVGELGFGLLQTAPQSCLPLALGPRGGEQRVAERVVVGEDARAVVAEGLNEGFPRELLPAVAHIVLRQGHLLVLGKDRLDDLIEHLRTDVHKVEDPQAKALFENFVAYAERVAAEGAEAAADD